MLVNEDDCVLLIIDIQERLLNAVFNNKIVEKNTEILVKAASILKIPVIITEQYPKGLGKTISSIYESVDKNNTNFYEKTAFSALENKDLENYLKNINKNQIILFGIETHICVNQTAQALINAGYDVSIISDACGSRGENQYLAGISRMKECGAHIITTEIALFEWLKTSQHPSFKEIQKLIK